MSSDELIKKLSWGAGIAIVLAVVVIFGTSAYQDAQREAASRAKVPKGPSAAALPESGGSAPVTAAQPKVKRKPGGSNAQASQPAEESETAGNREQTIFE